MVCMYFTIQLQIEQWMADFDSLLGAALSPTGSGVDIIKIQLTNVSRTAWLVEEQRLERPVT